MAGRTPRPSTSLFLRTPSTSVAKRSPVFPCLIVAVVLLAPAVLPCGAQEDNVTISVFVGVAFSSAASIESMEKVVEAINHDSSEWYPRIRFKIQPIALTNNPIQAALIVCEELVPEQAYALILSDPEGHEAAAQSISFTCGFYSIPVIGISSREAIYSEKNVHVSYLRTVPPFGHQALVWADLLKTYHWLRVIFIGSDDLDGRAVRKSFIDASTKYFIEIKKQILFEPNKSSYTEDLMPIMVDKQPIRVIVLYASYVEDIQYSMMLPFNTRLLM